MVLVADAPMNVLCLAAHADDEVLGCGGTLARHADAGDTVHVLVLTQPVARRPSLDRVNDRYGALENPPLERLGDARRAAEVLRATIITFAGFPEVATESYGLAALSEAIAIQVETSRPEIVLTHCGTDTNQDHRRAHEATLIAVRPWAHRGVRRVLGYRVDVHGLAPSGANVFVDISKHAETKQRALACYRSELRDFPHPRSLYGVIAADRYVGTKCGVAYAEEFVLLWERA